MAGDPDALLNTGDEPQVLLAAIDASNSASRVVSMAARLARSLPQARLHILHVFRTSRLDRAPPASDALHDAQEHLEFQVRAAKRQCRNQVSGHFLVGDPTSLVLRACGEHNVELLVVGTHDHKGFERLLLGSIAETLVRKAGCSVLVVRPSSSRALEG